MEGWKCVIKGIHEIKIDSDESGRNIEIKTVLSDGEEVSHHIKTSVPDYKGTHKDDVNYEKGDFTTWGGSLWHAWRDNPSGRPGTKDSGWKLAVKKGQNGKDAKPNR